MSDGEASVAWWPILRIVPSHTVPPCPFGQWPYAHCAAPGNLLY